MPTIRVNVGSRQAHTTTSVDAKEKPREPSSETLRTPTAAATAVLQDVPELIEHVLLQLPLRNIVCAQGVCRTWKNVIDNSPTIQKALFFRPCTQYKLHLVDTRGVYSGTWPNGSPTGIVNSTKGERIGARWAMDGNDKIQHQIMFNPMLGSGGPAFDNLRGGNAARFMFKAHQHPAASWRRMLLTQPPIEEVLISYPNRYINHIGNEEAVFWFSVDAQGGSVGVTLDDMERQASASNWGAIRSILGKESNFRLPFGRRGGRDWGGRIAGQVIADAIGRELAKGRGGAANEAKREGEAMI